MVFSLSRLSREIAHHSSQLVTQIILGVVCNDLKANERLPSTRELARRYKIHANTVSAAFRELTRLGWVEFRKGSGVYVKAEQRNNRSTVVCSWIS